MGKPNFSYERRLWQKGYKYLVGVDEVGRGAFAGPIVAAAVVFPRPTRTQSDAIAEICVLGINDSKILRPRERERLAGEIKKRALAWEITEVGVRVINRVGIGKATEKAMRLSIKNLKLKMRNDKEKSKMFVLVDGFHVKYIPEIGLKNQKAIKDGDQKSLSIAAASILAKVYRDKLMESLSRQSKYKKYGWGRNKGYGSREHQKAILRYGLTRFHRKKFVESFWEKRKYSP